MVLKQDKGRKVEVIDRKKYNSEKCLNLLHTDSLFRLDLDITKTIERKIQKVFT